MQDLMGEISSLCHAGRQVSLTDFCLQELILWQLLHLLGSA